jgi:hypothetical protein
MATRRSRQAIVLVLAAALALGAAGPAGADHVRVHDGDDTHGRLDIRAVAQGHRGKHKVTHKIVTYGDWRPRILKGDRNEIYIWFSTDDDKYAEARAGVDYHHGHLTVCFSGYDEGSDYAGIGPCEKAVVRRPNRHSVVVVLDDGFVGDDDHYGWTASSYFSGAGSKKCPAKDPCSDSVPKTFPRGAIVHQL